MTIDHIRILDIDVTLPSEDDVKKGRNFKRNMRRQKNVPVPGITIPMSVIQNRFKREG